MLEMLAQSLKDHLLVYVVLGAALVILGVVGGGITIKEARIPRISNVYRVVSIACGVILIGISVALRAVVPGENATAMANAGDIEPHDTGIERYRVCYVKPDDRDGGLVVREGPGVVVDGTDNLRAGVIPHDGRRVIYQGKAALVGHRYWFRVRYYASDDVNRQTVGWVNSFYLCPDDGECDCR